MKINNYNLPIIQKKIIRTQNHLSETKEDFVVVEEPLEIRVNYINTSQRNFDQQVAVTMRTPGNDYELVAGFLLAEGFINKPEQLLNISYCKNETNVVRAKITNTNQQGSLRGINPSGQNLLSTSSCGVCGKSSIEAAIATIPKKLNISRDSLKVDASILYDFPNKLNRNQFNFSKTGGIHAAATFNTSGTLLQVREDVGRHNALDKLIGQGVLEATLPFNSVIVLFSGRTSFELVQKSAIAGIPIIASIGAPSTLAIDLSKQLGITLIGFLKNSGFNIYSGEKRINNIRDRQILQYNDND